MNPPQQPSGRNRRRFDRVAIDGITLELVRVGFTARLPVSAATPAPNLAMGLLDLSGGGVRLLTWAPLSKGDRVVVKIRIPGVKRELSARAVIKWAKAAQVDGKNVFEVGAEFLDLETGDRLKLMELGKGGKPI
ncbi:MAG TPA: PilZ domain-containing protein [Planctomycetota bacterium]|nr:PilZ domain-containing protein [Planctomycetota bacterium]